MKEAMKVGIGQTPQLCQDALIEMLRELGYCTGIENYSRVISGRPVGSPPLTLIDYFPKDFLLFVDESHVTLPQVRGLAMIAATPRFVRDNDWPDAVERSVNKLRGWCVGKEPNPEEK